MSLLNNIFNIDEMEINSINKKYLKIFIVMILLIIGLLVIKKDCYYENDLLFNDNSIILIVDKDILNKIKTKKTLFVNKIESNYSINKIIDDGNICYIDIKLDINIENISNTKYKVLLGKETIFEYIVRIIKKIT